MNDLIDNLSTANNLAPDMTPEAAEEKVRGLLGLPPKPHPATSKPAPTLPPDPENKPSYSRSLTMRKILYALVLVSIITCSTTVVGTSYQNKRGDAKQESIAHRVLNLPDTPLQIQLSPNHRYIDVENHSDKTIKKYQLGCVIKEAGKIKCLRSVVERIIDLEPINRKNDRITAHSE